MELEKSPPFRSSTSFSSSYRWRRTVKRKLDMESEEEMRILKTLLLPSPEMATDAGSPPLVDLLARVEVENECYALRETLVSQQLTIQGLYGELDEERNASSSAASEAMSMILRLQREKAEIMMEARQFKRYAEEKMAHDQQEIALLEDAIYKREQMIHVLSYEVQAYRHKLLSYGVLSDFDLKELGLDEAEYPQIKCGLLASGGKSGKTEDLENFLPDAETPQTSGTSSSLTDTLEKGVVTGNSTSPLQRARQEEFPIEVDRVSDVGGDDGCDRIYMIDAVHRPNGVSAMRDSEEPVVDASIEEAEIKKLYLRLQALEADRESLKQELVLMQNEKGQNAQLELLREIAQNLSKGVVQPTPQKNTVVSKPWFFGIVRLPFASLLSVRVGVPILLIVGFLFMKKVHRQCSRGTMLR